MEIAAGGFSASGGRKQGVEEGADEVCGEYDADVGPCCSGREGECDGFGGEVEPMRNGADEKFH